MSNPIRYGLVLAGGRSTRMGADKSQLNYHGLPQREYLFRLLLDFCLQVYVSCKKADEIPEALNPLQDYYPFDNPMNGLLTAMRKFPDVSWLTVPVDMPNVDIQLIKLLTDSFDPHKTVTCFYDSSGELPEPLVALWQPNAYVMLYQFYAQGGVSLRQFIIHHPAKIIAVQDVSSLLNVNTAEQYEKYLEHRRKTV